MAHELLIDLLHSALKRPARRCMYHRQAKLYQVCRFASSSSRVPDTSAQQSTVPKSTSRALPKSTAPGANIPLHVGLDRNPENLSTFSRIPIPRGERGEKFTPSTLARPIGLPHPPRPGQNSPVDTRSWAEKKRDFADYDKAMERRKILARSYFRPYFQEWKRVDHWKGKSFVANERLFKREKALYFPNIWGRTLSKTGDGVHNGRDTTPCLLGKVSVVAIQSGRWAEEQIETFVSKKDNPQLHEIIKSSGGLAQRADVNIQTDWTRAMLVKVFQNRIRTLVPEEQWERYFMVKLPRDVGRGLTEDIRDAMGLLNSQVGYVYLLDTDCRIRWAGSGHAWAGEVDSLNSGLKRLIEEAKTVALESKARLLRLARKDLAIQDTEPDRRNGQLRAATA